MNSEQQLNHEPVQNPPESGETRAGAPLRDVSWQRRPVYAEDPRFKSPIMAAFMSLVPGLGQVYVGYYRQGFINIVVIGTLISLLAQGPEFHWPLTPLLVFFMVFYWLYNIVDAARRASFFNQALSGIPASNLPPEFRMPETRGSLGAGILMIAAGLIIASRTVFGYSLEWVRHYWPLAPILFGVYLVVQSLRERRSK